MTTRAAAAAITLLLMVTCSPALVERRAGEGDAAAAPAGVVGPSSADASDASDAPPAPAPDAPPAPAPAADQAPEPPAPAPAPPAPAPPAPAPAPPRPVVESAWAPFAAVGGVVLHHPSSRVERVGFHESNHDGARQMEILPSAANPVVLETRERDTGSQTAADVVVDPGAEIRAPVTGTVRRAGGYVLYCRYHDHYVVIEPDARPGWEVKVLHIGSLRVGSGARVVAGATVLATGPTPLPFASQVDDHTSRPHWPHVHIEVVDPSIPDRPSPGGGC